MTEDDNKSGEKLPTEKPKPEESQEIVYYYSREHRLSRASQAVRDMNDPSKNAKQGFLKSMTGNRANLLMLVSILIISAMIIIGNRSQGSTSAALNLGNNRVTVSIQDIDGILFLSVLKIIPQRTDVFGGYVFIYVFPVNPAPDDIDFEHSVFFDLEQSEQSFLVSLPFEGDNFVVMLQNENETLPANIRKTTR